MKNINDVAGGKLKETGTTHWSAPNEVATNSSGFTALPGGDRGSGGTFSTIDYDGSWWSSSEYSATSAYYRDMGHSSSGVSRGGGSKLDGFSVRCLRDL